jgi:hypothetical protein
VPFYRYISELNNKQMSENKRAIKRRIDDSLEYIVFLTGKLGESKEKDEVIKKEIELLGNLCRRLLKYLN